MKKKVKWEILEKENVTKEDLLKILLKNRGLTTEKEQEKFLHPDITEVTAQSVGIDKTHLTKALTRITKAIEKKEQMCIFGDYDVDGICGTAILWETLYGLGAKVIPYIPSRVDEGYGLSIAGIENVLKENPATKLIITVDNGIVAKEAVAFANTKGIDVIITDHHTKETTLPKAYAIVHTTEVCGTGVAYLLSQEIQSLYSSSEHGESRSSKENSSRLRSNNNPSDHLALVALATVADLVPLQHANRTLLTHGLQELKKTTRPGIVAICQEAGIVQNTIGVYEIGHMIGPRLNAMGRIASAMDSLRLLCTKDRLKAKVLAEKLGLTNKERQLITKSLSQHAIMTVGNSSKKFLFIADASYDEGVIGLIAGKLVEEFYRPSIVIAMGEKISKASARSVAGFNIIAYIRTAQHLLLNAGGHPMAAGFTVETEKVELLRDFLEKRDEKIADELLEKQIKIDCALPLAFVNQELYDSLQQLAPFGMSNPEPTFLAKAKIISVRQVGKEKNHLSLQLAPSFSAVAFGMGDRMSDLKIGQTVEIVYTIDENEWNNKKSLQLKVKDIK